MLAARWRRRCHHADAQSLRIDYTSGSCSHANVFVRAEEDDEEDELHHRSLVPPDEITRFHFGFQFGFVRSGRRNASAVESSSQTGAELRNRCVCGCWIPPRLCLTVETSAVSLCSLRTAFNNANASETSS